MREKAYLQRSVMEEQWLVQPTWTQAACERTVCRPPGRKGSRPFLPDISQEEHQPVKNHPRHSRPSAQTIFPALVHQRVSGASPGPGTSINHGSSVPLHFPSVVGTAVEVRRKASARHQATTTLQSHLSAGQMTLTDLLSANTPLCAKEKPVQRRRVEVLENKEDTDFAVIAENPASTHQGRRDSGFQDCVTHLGGPRHPKRSSRGVTTSRLSQAEAPVPSAPESSLDIQTTRKTTRDQLSFIPARVSGKCMWTFESPSGALGSLSHREALEGDSISPALQPRPPAEQRLQDCASQRPKTSRRPAARRPADTTRLQAPVAQRSEQKASCKAATAGGIQPFPPVDSRPRRHVSQRGCTAFLKALEKAGLEDWTQVEETQETQTKVQDGEAQTLQEKTHVKVSASINDAFAVNPAFVPPTDVQEGPAVHLGRKRKYSVRSVAELCGVNGLDLDLFETPLPRVRVSLSPSLSEVAEEDNRDSEVE